MRHTVNGVTFEFCASNLHLRSMQAGGQSWVADERAGHAIWTRSFIDSRRQYVEIDGDAAIFDALHDGKKERFPLEYIGRKPRAAMEGETLVLRWEGMRIGRSRKECAMCL